MKNASRQKSKREATEWQIATEHGRECDLLKRSGEKRKQDDGDEDPIRWSNLSCTCTCFYMRPCHFYILGLAWYCLAHVLSRLVSCLLFLPLSLCSARCDSLFSYSVRTFLIFHIVIMCVIAEASTSRNSCPNWSCRSAMFRPCHGVVGLCIQR